MTDIQIVVDWLSKYGRVEIEDYFDHYRGKDKQIVFEGIPVFAFDEFFYRNLTLDETVLKNLFSAT